MEYGSIQVLKHLHAGASCHVLNPSIEIFGKRHRRVYDRVQPSAHPQKLLWLL